MIVSEELVCIRHVGLYQSGCIKGRLLHQVRLDYIRCLMINIRQVKLYEKQIGLYQTGLAISEAGWIVSDRLDCFKGRLDCIRQVWLYQQQT